MRTAMLKKGETKAKWFVVDASGEILGRMASRIARIIMGKTKVSYTPHVLCGDHVIVLNAAQVNLTGKKLERKVYIHNTFWPGGLRTRPMKNMMENRPEEIVRLAVRRMLPKSRLGRQMIRQLHVYAGAEHRHKAQMPEPLKFGTLKKQIN